MNARRVASASRWKAHFGDPEAINKIQTLAGRISESFRKEKRDDRLSSEDYRNMNRKGSDPNPVARRVSAWTTPGAREPFSAPHPLSGPPSPQARERQYRAQVDERSRCRASPLLVRAGVGQSPPAVELGGLAAPKARARAFTAPRDCHSQPRRNPLPFPLQSAAMAALAGPMTSLSDSRQMPCASRYAARETLDPVSQPQWRFPGASLAALRQGGPARLWALRF